MDFEAVPAGTDAPTALTLRGPDHVLEVAPTDSFAVLYNDTLKAVNVGGTLHFKYADVAGVLMRGAFTTDTNVLTGLVHGRVPSPAFLRNLYLRMVHDGLPDDAALTMSESDKAIEEVLAGLDLSSLHASYLDL